MACGQGVGGLALSPTCAPSRRYLHNHFLRTIALLSIFLYHLENCDVVGSDDNRVSLIEGEVYRFELLKLIRRYIHEVHSRFNCYRLRTQRPLAKTLSIVSQL